MMNTPENEIIVLDIAGARARVTCANQTLLASLNALGFNAEGDQMVRPILDVKDRQDLVKALINLGALFSGGPDWSPAELVEFYRDQGAVSSNFRMITWKNQNEYLIVDR